MITNGTLVVLVSKTPASCSHDDLGGLRNDGSLRHYFGIIAQATSKENALNNAKGGRSYETIVAIEKAFFPTKKDRTAFKKKLEKMGILPEHILFGEDYASGSGHIRLRIHELCG